MHHWNSINYANQQTVTVVTLCKTFSCYYPSFCCRYSITRKITIQFEILMHSCGLKHDTCNSVLSFVGRYTEPQYVLFCIDVHSNAFWINETLNRIQQQALLAWLTHRVLQKLPGFRYVNLFQLFHIWTKLRSQLVFRDSVISCRKGKVVVKHVYTNSVIRIHVYAKRQTWIWTTWPSFSLNCR